MSRSPPVVSKVGKSWYSISATSGALLALMAVYNLLYSRGPAPTLTQLTWISGWDLLKSATCLSMFGIQAQYVKVTGPVEELLFGELEPPQAARGTMSRSATATKAKPDAKRRSQGKVEKSCIV